MITAGTCCVLLMAVLVLRAADGAELPCCFGSARNATTLSPVVVLRRDEDRPRPQHDPTWEATLRRAAARALGWDRDPLAAAPFITTQHGAAALAALDEPSDIRVLARGLLLSARDDPVFQEAELPGEPCRLCAPEDIMALWSVRRLRHSGPNADRRPCYELQFSVTPVVTELPTAAAPLARWTGDSGRQRELRPKGLVLRVQPTLDSPEALQQQPTSRRGTDQKVQQHLHHHFYVSDGVPLYAGTTTEKHTTMQQPFRPSPQFHEYSQPDPLFHSTTLPGHTTTFPGHPSTLGSHLNALHTHPMTRPSYSTTVSQLSTLPQHHNTLPEYSATVSSYPTLRPGHSGMQYEHPTTLPGHTEHPNSINEQLPPVVGDIDTRVPYVQTTRPSANPTRRLPTTSKLRTHRPGSLGTAPTHTQMYRITGEYTIATPNSLEKNKHNQHHYEIGNRPTKAYTSSLMDTKSRPHHGETSTTTSTKASPASTSKVSDTIPYLTPSSVRGAVSTTALAPTTGITPLFTPHYGGKDFGTSLLHVMKSKVPSYIDLFTENGTRFTTAKPLRAHDGDEHPRTTRHPNDHEGDRGPVSPSRDVVTSSVMTSKDSSALHDYASTLTQEHTEKISTTLQTKRPDSALTTVTTTPARSKLLPTTTREIPTSSSVTYFVASEDLSKLPLASTLTSDPVRQDDAGYTILNSVKESIEVMKHENDTMLNRLETSTDITPITKRADSSEESTNILVPGLVNGHTNYLNSRHHNTMENEYFSPTKISVFLEEPTTTRRPWRPSIKRPGRLRSNYKQKYLPRKKTNHNTTVTPVDPTSIVESRRTYSVRMSRRNKPSNSHQRKSNFKIMRQKQYEKTQYNLARNSD